MRSLHTLVIASVVAALLVVACGSDEKTTVTAAATEPRVDGSLSVPCDDPVDAVYGAPEALPADKGSIIKCAPDRTWTREALEAYARKNKYAYDGKPFVSGARAFRVSYRTERGAEPATPGFTSALVMLPDTPVSGAPAIVVAHGTAGQGPACAPSKDKFSGSSNPYAAMIFPLVGSGYPVIVPDYAGYAGYGANGNPPSGYAMSADVGRSVLDGLRALRRLAPGLSSDKSIIVGHSQGGHSALSALALAESYGVDVTGVVTYAPLWFNQATWGALLLVAQQYPIADNTLATSVGVWYHYSHAELLDGPGRGLEIFAESKRAAIKEFFDTTCSGNTERIKELGTLATDLYTREFTGSIRYAAALGSSCADGDDVCKKWVARYAADRPRLAGKAKTVPQLVLYGTADTTIPPGRAMCAFDRLRSDGAAASICVDTGMDHGSIVGARSAYVNDWIANVAIGAAAPAPCAADETSLQVQCLTPPAND